MTRFRAVAAAMTVLAATVAPRAAQTQELGSASAPDSFNVDIAAAPMLIEISAPAVLPLDVAASVAYSQVGINSQPRVQSTAGPVFVPLLSDVGLLGGPSGVLSTVIRLAPGLIVGLPTLFGLDPLPIDSSQVDVGPLAQLANGLPLPALPPLGCTSYFPDVPNEVSCGGPVQDFFGFQLGAGSARTVSSGEVEDPASLASRSDASVVGVGPTAANSLIPFAVANVASTAESKVVEGRITAAATAQASGLDIAGALTVSEVRASYSAAMGGTTETFDESPLRCDVGEVLLAGQRISLDDEGLTLSDTTTPAPLDPIFDGLDDILALLGGQVGDADFGSVVITPNPQPTSEVSADGTQVNHRFGCLEIRYRNATAGTDMKITLGNLAVTMSAFLDAPFGSPIDAGASTDGGFDGSGPIVGSDMGSLPELGEDLALPAVPDAGSAAPPASDEPFLNTGDGAVAKGWGIDGGWFAPFTLLAMSLPVLVRSRRFAPSLPDRLRRR